MSLRRCLSLALALAALLVLTLSSLSTHSLHHDGLLYANPHAQHPIPFLVSHARSLWALKLAKASTSLSRAVTEYQRRYRRKPPRGFDAWWRYVRLHNVQLPDEYDQIAHDLEPFWGIHPTHLQRIQAEWEAHQDSYTLGKHAGHPIGIVNATFAASDRSYLLDTARAIVELLKDVQHAIPPFRAVFSPDDNPNLLTDWDLRDMALQAAANGKVIDLSNPPKVKHSGWLSACPPTSKAWLVPLNPLTAPSTPLNPTTSRRKTFIHNHRLSMDPCLHPSHLTTHGQFISHRRGPVPHRYIVPQFSYSPTMLHHDITPAMPINWVGSDDDDTKWDDKVDERLLWRGRNTGIWRDGQGSGKEADGNGIPWVLAQRDRLVEYINDNLNDTIHVLSTGHPYKKSHLFPSLFDVSFASEPVSCQPTTCTYLSEHKFEFRPHQSHRQAAKYKYILDVDGNAWSSRFKRLITSNSLILKATIYPEWWLDRSQAWVHYVPIQIDYSDLVDVMLFFRHGDNEKLAKGIAKAGKEWALAFWRKEDLTAYLFRLFLEYARVMSVNRDSMSFEYVGEA